ncbi:MAG: radical SAM protein [Dehalococcoidales bacterium]|nr:radical SAM protein [Dehalococcoidales bacterium]
MPRVTFIYPCVGRFPGTRYVRSWQMQPLAIGVLSALTPAGWQKSFYDDRLEAIDFSQPTDLAAISIETFTARRGYQIADEYRKKGIPVVLGGYHATLCPEEAREHADSVCIGEAEKVWQHILNDASGGKLASVYSAPRSANLAGIRTDRGIFEGKHYFKLAMVESGRGCRFNCSFCSISAFYQSTYRRRPVDEIIGEIKQLKEKVIFFVDDNIVGDTATGRELFKALIPLKINWIGQCSINAATDTALLELMSQSGCRGLLVGLESLHAINLNTVGKAINQTIDYEQALGAFRKNGISIYGTFMFGFPADSTRTIRDAVDFARRQKLFLAAFAQIIPFPGTPLYSQFEAENRLMYPDWWLSDHYLFGQAPFYPVGMSPAELEQSCYAARRDFYSFSSILQRGREFSANCARPRMAGVFYGLNYLMHREVSRKFGIPMGMRETPVKKRSPHVVAEIAGPDNDAEIRNLLCQIPVPGAVQITYLYNPSFMASMKVEGRQSDIITGRDTDTGKLIGLGTRSIKPAFVNGELSPLGYLGSLRLAEEYRGSTYLARGYRELKRLHQAGPARLYITTIIESNKKAREILTSGRAGLPAYHDFGRFCSLAIGLRRSPSRLSLPDNLLIRPAVMEDIPSLIEFWQREGSRRQFFPGYSAADLIDPEGLLGGLAPDDILLAFKEDKLVGTTGAWNQEPFRQSRVTGYNRWLGMLRSPYNLTAGRLGYPLLPRPGSDLDYFNLALVCISNDDRKVFAALLSQLLAKYHGSFDFFMAGLHEHDPLLPVLAKYRHFNYYSRLYVVCWEDGEHDFHNLDGRVPYLELGAL